MQAGGTQIQMGGNQVQMEHINFCGIDVSGVDVCGLRHGDKGMQWLDDAHPSSAVSESHLRLGRNARRACAETATTKDNAASSAVMLGHGLDSLSMAAHNSSGIWKSNYPPSSPLVTKEHDRGTSQSPFMHLPHTSSGRTRGLAMEPDAFSADDIIPTQVHQVLQVPSTTVSVLEPSLRSAPTPLSSSSLSAPPIPPPPPPPSPSLPVTNPSSTHMTQEKEDRVASNLIKTMPVFAGGTKGSEDWPLFWARLSSIMKLSRYSPLGDELVTTYGDGELRKQQLTPFLVALKTH